MKTVYELLSELKNRLEDEIKSCEDDIRYSETDQEYDDAWGRKTAYEDVLCWVEDYKRENT